MNQLSSSVVSVYVNVCTLQEDTTSKRSKHYVNRLFVGCSMFFLWCLYFCTHCKLWQRSCAVVLMPVWAPWFRGRASDSRLRGHGFESCAAVLKPWASFFTLHCSSPLSCINEYLAIDNGGYVYEQPSRINCSIWLDASPRSWDGVWLNRSAREVKCKALWAILRIGYCAI